MNGAGKSTLFKALTGFVRPSRGRVRINGCGVQEAQRQQAVAYVPQSESINSEFPVSVWDVVMMGRYGSMNLLRLPRSSDRVAVRDALARVELSELRDRPLAALSVANASDLPGQGDCPTGRCPAADEPFNGVDVRTEKRCLSRFAVHDEGRTILISTHDLSHARESPISWF